MLLWCRYGAERAQVQWIAYVTKRSRRERILPESSAVFDPIVTLEMPRLKLYPAVIEITGVARREGCLSTCNDAWLVPGGFRDDITETPFFLLLFRIRKMGGALSGREMIPRIHEAPLAYWQPRDYCGVCWK